MNETIEIIKEARKAGMQAALILFGTLILVSLLFAFFIYETFQTPPTGIVEATQTTNIGNNKINQGVK